jgi:hypothetical protein
LCRHAHGLLGGLLFRIVGRRLRLRRPGGDPRQNPLDILIREVLQPSIGRASGIVFPQHIRDRIRIDLLPLGQQSVGFIGVAYRLLVQAAFGEPTRL